MRAAWLVISLLCCAPLWQARANSQDAACTAALINDQAHYAAADRLRLAMASLVQRGDLAALGFKPGAGAVVYGIPWAGALDGWDNDKADYLSQYEYESRDDKSWLYVSTHLSPAGAKSLLDCLKQRQPDARVYLTVEKIDDRSAYLTVTAGSKGWTAAAKSVEITAREGSQLLAKTRLEVPPNGARSVTLARDSDADLSVAASLDGALGDQITIPAEPYLKSCSMPIAPDGKPVPEGSTLTFLCPMLRAGKTYTVEAAGRIAGDAGSDPAGAGKKVNVELAMSSSGLGRAWQPKLAPLPHVAVAFSLVLDEPALKVRKDGVEVSIAVRQCNAGAGAARTCLFEEGSVVEVQVKP